MIRKRLLTAWVISAVVAVATVLAQARVQLMSRGWVCRPALTRRSSTSEREESPPPWVRPTGCTARAAQNSAWAVRRGFTPQSTRVKPCASYREPAAFRKRVVGILEGSGSPYMLTGSLVAARLFAASPVGASPSARFYREDDRGVRLQAVLRPAGISGGSGAQ